MKKRILALLLAVTTAFALTACGSGNTTASSGSASTASTASDPNFKGETIKIAYLPITHALAVFEAAEELKDNPDVRVELVKYGSWTELMDALNTGNVDGASVLVELAMKSKQEGIGLKAVALGHKDGNVIVASDKVQSAEDLKGKTIAIPHRQSSHNILVNLELAKANLTVNDIKITELAPTEMPSALASGQIDGYCVAEPFGAQAVSLGVGHVLDTSESLWPDSLCCALVMTDDYLNNHKESADKFIAAYKTAGANLNKDNELTIAEQYLGQDADVLKTSLEWISYDDLDITQDIYNSLVEKVKTYGLSDNPPTYQDFVYQAS